MAEHGNNELINYSKKKNRTVIPMVLVVSLIIGLLVGAMSFFFAYRYMISDESDAIPEDTFSANDMVGQVQANLIGSDIDAVVKEIDTGSKTITFYNIKNETSISVTVTDNTSFPADVTFDTIKVGDLYTYVFNEEKQLTELKDCESAWTVADVGLSVNINAKLVKFSEPAEKYADTSYKYVEDLTTVRYKNEIVGFEVISPLDYVELKGYDNGKINKVYSITIEKSHGELQFQNVNAIDDPMVEINGQKYEIDDDDPRILLTEGNYTIIISGDNCDEISKEINIDPNTPFVIDLAKIMVKSGVLDVTTNVDGCKLYVNDKEYKIGESILLEYGSYEVRATKDGYNEAKKTVEIDSDNVKCQLDLDKIDKSGTISVTVSPADAQISIDGVLYGTGSVTQTMPLGSYIVSASADGYATSKKQVNITAEGQQIPVDFVLAAAQ